MVAATVITALAHTSPVLGNVRNAVLGNGAVGIDYEYNLRGWTTNVTSNVFSQQIRHQDPTDGGTPRFNGNISAIVWDQAATGNAVARHGEYRYAYDGLDRLTAANYTGIDNRNHSCLYTYDCMGNATSIKRYGITDRIDAGGSTSCSYGVIDDVTLTYNGNRLVCADDAADALVYAGAMDFHDGANEQTEYAYDANGNLTKDLNRGIESITYDRNNMPTEITFTSGARTCYTYDADGRKLRVCHYGRRGEKRDELDYIGDMVLRNGALERILTPSGYIENDTIYTYVKDYQGNVRNVVREDGAVVESNEYYPYGGLFSATPSVQPYKYGAKELDRTHGLDWYDSQARFYDSVLLRTNSIDKKAGDYTWLSPYLWCAANPIHFTDPTGMYLLNEDGSKVDYLNNTLSENADDGVKTIVFALQLTEQGNKVLNELVSAKYGIHLILSNEVNDDVFGYTLTKTQECNPNDNEIYDKTFEKAAIVVIQNNIENKAKEDVYLNKSQLSKLELINIIAVHEGVHATNPKYNSVINTNKDDDTEYLPLKYEAITLEEILNKH